MQKHQRSLQGPCLVARSHSRYLPPGCPYCTGLDNYLHQGSKFLKWLQYHIPQIDLKMTVLVTEAPIRPGNTLDSWTWRLQGQARTLFTDSLGPKRPHKHKALTSGFKSQYRGGYLKSCLVGSLCSCVLLGPDSRALHMAWGAGRERGEGGVNGKRASDLKDP